MTAPIRPLPLIHTLLFWVLCWCTGLVAAQDAGEDRLVDSRIVRVRLDGIVDLRVRQGAVAALRISGDRRYLDKVTAEQSGDTLVLDTAIQGVRLSRPSLRAELVLPRLRELVSEGMGSTEVSGFTGDELEITLDGAGSMKLTSEYRRLRANLGGVGSMQLWVKNSDSIELDLRGAGYVTMGGRSRLLRASLGGLGGLNAQQFEADSVSIDLSGLGNATVNARTNLDLNLSGLGSVVVYGKPLNRNVSVDGLGRVSWK
jgi:Putative auto-transporter adhesin, head GIN domain